jgi:hypothetical protein
MTMNLKTITAMISIFSMSLAFAQAPASGQQSLAATLGIYVFPAKGQSATQQSEDEATCYKWAVSNTGVDPFAAQQQQAATAQASQQAQGEIAAAGQGAGAKGAVGGAAVGALIGGLADGDAGKGAAWGAGLGLIASRRHARREQEAASQQVAAQTQQAQQATQQQLDDFKKAFSACLEGKNYIAK